MVLGFGICLFDALVWLDLDLDLAIDVYLSDSCLFWVLGCLVVRGVWLLRLLCCFRVV